MEDNGYYEMMKEDYDEMLVGEYDEFAPHYDGQIDFEDWRCLVDVHYRQKHGKFPVWDDDMYGRLVDAAVDVGRGLIAKHEEILEEADTKTGYRRLQLTGGESLQRGVEVLTRVIFPGNHAPPPSN